MATRYKSTDYMFASARLRALECRLITREATERMLNASDTEALLDMLENYGYEGMSRASSAWARESILISKLAQCYASAEQMSDGRKLIDFMRYPYDCNNLKVMIKCNARGISSDGLITDVGSVCAKAASDAFENGVFSAFPRHMADAVAEAREALARSRDPQLTDLILDRACFADMLDNSRQYGIELAERLVRTKIDLTNIITCARIIRMKLGNTAVGLFDSAVLEGGLLDTDILRGVLGAEPSELSDCLEYTEYGGLSAYIGAELPLAQLERQADGIWLSVAKQAKAVPFGAEVIIGYAAAVEYEIKNIRILLAGKETGFSAESIRERLRESYV